MWILFISKADRGKNTEAKGRLKKNEDTLVMGISFNLRGWWSLNLICVNDLQKLQKKVCTSTQLVTDEGHNPENWKLLLYLH